MSHSCLISICIPAYRRPQNIDRLLYSISIQTFKDYEIIITDDSRDDSLKAVLQKYGQLPIVYHKNEQSLGTPANWNFGISLAKGEWIKIMHDDDWFVDENSLQNFVRPTSKGNRFIVSRYYNVFESGKKEQPSFPKDQKDKIIHQPMLLLAKNVIGPPSVTLIHSSIKERYDTFMQWRVDIDYYVRILLKEKSFELIDEPLINVGISETQVTNFSINKPEVELPEGLLLLHKYGVTPLWNIAVYDAWWRILRNVNIRSTEQLKQFTPFKEWPELILKMVRQQSRIPLPVLKFGPFSKMAMSLSYLLNKNYLKG
jgi:glycosyltransferase involved in cell wall biosynthesis